MNSADLRDLLGILFFGGCICLPALVTVAALIVSTVVKVNQRTAHVKLAQALGYTPLTPESDPQQAWYGGLHRGRRVAIHAYSSTYRYYAIGRSRRGFSVRLRVVMAVQVPQPLGAGVYRGPEKSDIPPTFEAAFEMENAGSLSSAARDALLAFVYLGYPVGLTPDLSFRFSPGTRNLRLRDRANPPEGLLAAEVLADERVILVHDFPDANLSPDRLRALLDQMAVVAEAIETDRRPAALAGQPIPPKAGLGKYAAWAVAGLLLLGLPGGLCLCGMVMAYLGA